MRAGFFSVGPNDRVLLIGDIHQHQSVEAGRPFEQLQDAGMRTATLDDIVRQRDPGLKSAVELLATGQVSAALDALQQQGRVKEIPNQGERIRAIAVGGEMSIVITVLNPGKVAQVSATLVTGILNKSVLPGIDVTRQIKEVAP